MTGVRLLILLLSVLLRGLGDGRPDAEKPSNGRSPAVLTTARQILNLGTDEAARVVHRVALTGVVTCPMAGIPWVYLQDATAGMLVIYTNRQLRLEPGQRVEVSGQTFSGQFAVHVDRANVRVTGNGALPEPKRADPARLAAGEDFGSWVVLQGRVVDVYKLGDTAVLRLNSGNWRFSVHGPVCELGAVPAGSGVPEDWLDARVEVRGICWTEVDSSNRPYLFRLHSPGSNFVTVLEPGNPNLFRRDVTPISAVRLT